MSCSAKKRNKNFRGMSHESKDLSWENFSEADIKGASFTKSILASTNFS